MFELLLDPAAWISLLALTTLEIVLGIDNLIFISIISSRVEPAHQKMVRRVGLVLALLGRLVLLACIVWIIGLTQPLLTLGEFALSWRDLILIGGGVFLLIKATMEMHEMLEPVASESEASATVAVTAGITWVLVQIALIDLVFSLDSILTAVGMTVHIPIMVVAIVIAMVIMICSAEPVANFVQRHPTVKMLALAFLLLIGVTLVADGLHFHIPRGYIYSAVAFAVGVEALNIWRSKRRPEVEPEG